MSVWRKLATFPLERDALRGDTSSCHNLLVPAGDDQLRVTVIGCRVKGISRCAGERHNFTMIKT